MGVFSAYMFVHSRGQNNASDPIPGTAVQDCEPPCVLRIKPASSARAACALKG